MPITFQCPNPNCQRRMTVKDELAGKRGTCTACKQPIVVPSANGTAAPAAAAKPPTAPAAAKPAATPLKPRVAAAAPPAPATAKAPSAAPAAKIVKPSAPS